MSHSDLISVGTRVSVQDDPERQAEVENVAEDAFETVVEVRYLDTGEKQMRSIHSVQQFGANLLEPEVEENTKLNEQNLKSKKKKFVSIVEPERPTTNKQTTIGQMLNKFISPHNWRLRRQRLAKIMYYWILYNSAYWAAIAVFAILENAELLSYILIIWCLSGLGQFAIYYNAKAVVSPTDKKMRYYLTYYVIILCTDVLVRLFLVMEIDERYEAPSLSAVVLGFHAVSIFVLSWIFYGDIFLTHSSLSWSNFIFQWCDVGITIALALAAISYNQELITTQVRICFFYAISGQVTFWILPLVLFRLASNRQRHRWHIVVLNFFTDIPQVVAAIYVIATDNVHEGIALLTMVKVFIMLRQFEYNLIFAGTLDMFATEKSLEKYVKEEEDEEDPYQESDMEIEEDGDEMVGSSEMDIPEEPPADWDPVHRLMKEKKSGLERGVGRFEKASSPGEKRQTLNQATLHFIESKQALQLLKKSTSPQHQDIFDRIETETVRTIQRFSKALESYIISEGKHSPEMTLSENLKGQVEIEPIERMNLHQFLILMEERGDDLDHSAFSSLPADDCGDIPFGDFKIYGEVQVYLQKMHHALQI